MLPREPSSLTLVSYRFALRRGANGAVNVVVYRDHGGYVSIGAMATGLYAVAFKLPSSVFSGGSDRGDGSSGQEDTPTVEQRYVEQYILDASGQIVE